MVNKIKSLIGALALSGAGLLSAGSSDPVLDIAVTSSPVYLTGRRATVSATNLQSNATMSYYQFQRALSPTGTWSKVGSNIGPQSSPTNTVSVNIDMLPNNPYFNGSFFRVYGVKKN